NFATTPTTTLFGIDFTNSVLVRIGGVNGSPSPNGGVLTTIGGLGVTLGDTTIGFDITSTNTALAILTVGGTTSLYSINLSNGAATSIGAVGTGSTQFSGLALAPQPAIVAGQGPGGGGLVNVFDTQGHLLKSFQPYAGFTGPINVGTGDVNND